MLSFGLSLTPTRNSIKHQLLPTLGTTRTYSATSALLKGMDKTNTGGSSRSQRGGKKPMKGSGGTPSSKLRGLPHDSPEVRLSKTLSWILRHGAAQEGLQLRPDGYARVHELLNRPKLKDLTLEGIQSIVADDSKSRYSLTQEPDPSSGSGEPIWWIRANQGHSMKTVKLDLQPVESTSDIPTGVAVHGTNARAWKLIKTQGLSKMTRNHIHLAQGVSGSGVVSGMRNSANVLVYVDVQKALDAGLKFFLSSNGVVLTEGDESGHLGPQFFQRVTDNKGNELGGWQTGPVTAQPGGSNVAQESQEAKSVSDVQVEIEKLSL